MANSKQVKKRDGKPYALEILYYTLAHWPAARLKAGARVRFGFALLREMQPFDILRVLQGAVWKLHGETT